MLSIQEIRWWCHENTSDTKRVLLSLRLIALLISSPLRWRRAHQTTITDKKNTNENKAPIRPRRKPSDANEQKEVSRRNRLPTEPWYANSQGAYTVSLGTGQLISLYPQVRNDQTIPNGEYVEGEQSVSLKSRDYKYQMFYGVSASSIYTNSIGGVGVGSDLVSTSVNPYLAVFLPTQTGRFLLQYSTVINPNDTQNGGPQAYHTLTFSAMGSLSARWYWMASIAAATGQNLRVCRGH